MTCEHTNAPNHAPIYAVCLNTPHAEPGGGGHSAQHLPCGLILWRWVQPIAGLLTCAVGVEVQFGLLHCHHTTEGSVTPMANPNTAPNPQPATVDITVRTPQ